MIRIEITDAPSYREAVVEIRFTHVLDDKPSSAQTVALTIQELEVLRDRINEQLGEDTLVDVGGEGTEALMDALAATRDRKFDGPLSARAGAVEAALEAKGYRIAKAKD